jgi:hypothetical protein
MGWGSQFIYVRFSAKASQSLGTRAIWAIVSYTHVAL